MKKFTAIVLAPAVAASLIGCSAVRAQPEQQIVTQDNIEPTTTVEEVVNSVPADVTYPYLWLAEDLDKTVQMIKDGEMMQHMQDAPPEVFDNMKAEFERERNTNHIVSAQEAANIAGAIMEQSYGYMADEQTPLVVALVSDGDRTLWYVNSTSMDMIAYEDVDEWHVHMQIDAITGMLELVNSTPGDLDTYFDLNQIPRHEAFVQLDPEVVDGTAMGYWDESHPEYETYINTVRESIKTALDGSAILQGASIVSIENQFEYYEYYDAPNKVVRTGFFVTLDNGRDMYVSDYMNIAPLVGYDNGGHTLIGYNLQYDYETPPELANEDYVDYDNMEAPTLTE